MPDYMKATYVNPRDYPDCTSYVLTDLTFDDPMALPGPFTMAGLTVKLTYNKSLKIPAYQVKIWDARGTEPASLSTQKAKTLLSLLKKPKKAVKKAAAKKKAAPKRKR